MPTTRWSLENDRPEITATGNRAASSWRRARVRRVMGAPLGFRMMGASTPS